MLDLLTGMVLMSIIIGMVYYLFTSVNRQVIEFARNKSELQSQQSMQCDLKWQANKSTALIRNPKGFDIHFSTGETIGIERKNEFLLRKKENQKDTLTKKLVDLKFELVRDKDNRETDIIKRVVVISQVTKVNLSFNLNKTYSAAERINAALIREY